jgi:aminoglycoside phosphotransferase (APT) family kinase protein
VSRSQYPKFEAEEKAISLSLKAGVPAPKVLLIEQMQNGDEKLTFCIEEKIKGEALRELMPSLDIETRNSFIIEAGEILSKIHSVQLPGFGNLDRDVPFKTWEDFIFHLEDKKEKILTSGEKVGIDSVLINQAFEILRNNSSAFTVKEARLLHGDFGPKHLLVQEGHITGIIDFENAKGGDPVYDFAWLNYFHGESFSVESLREGYLDKNLFNENFELKMKLYRLHLGLGFIHYYESEKNEPGTNHAKKCFINELQDFEI